MLHEAWTLPLTLCILTHHDLGRETMERVDVLLVEDNQFDAEMALRWLRNCRSLKYSHWVKDGQEALDFLSCKGNYSGRDDVLPRLILLDINMPKVGGFEVLESIKAHERLKSIPVVIMTSSGETDDIEKAHKLGVICY